MTETMAHRIVVLGGGYAGLTAAARLSETLPDADIALIDAKPQFVERIRLHEIAAGGIAQHLPYDEFMSARNGRFIQARAEKIDPDDRIVHLAPGTVSPGLPDTVEYDTLVYAPGSMTDRNTVPGADRFAVCLDSTEDCAETAARLETLAETGGRGLIAGGGLTAIEAACEFGERMPGLKVLLAPGRNFGPDDAPGGLSRAGFDHVVATLDRLGVETVAGARITGVGPDHAELENGDTIAYDLCLWAAGFLVPDLAARAGIKVTGAGQIVTDHTLTSVSHPDIVAVGDAAHVETQTAGTCRMSCAAGRPMGERAAKTVAARIGGMSADAFEFSYSFRCVSLGRKDGLIQFVDSRDRPVEQVWTGERGAGWKEYICRRTLAGPPPDTPPRIA